MRWEVIRMYEDGKRLPDKELLSAIGVVADVRVQAVMLGSRVVTAALMDACPNPYPRLVEPRLAGIAMLALGIEGFEEIVLPGESVYQRQCWLCREPRR
jgi:hypothetical protein